jgi:hypothetical protein
MIIDTIKDIITANIGVTRPAPKNWQKMNCRLCYIRNHGKDHRFRFGIQYNPDSIAMHCFNCGFSSSYTEGKELSKSFKLFLKNISVSDKAIEQLEFEIFKQKNQIKTLRMGDEESPVTLESKFKSLFHTWQPVSLPKESKTIENLLENGCDDPDFLTVANYAISRKIFDLDKFYWSPDTHNNLNQRLIIPYLYKNKIVGFTARLHYTTIDKSIPKYIQQCPEDFVYNIDNQDDYHRKYVIVTEGVLDAWMVDGVATLGEIGQTKIDIINRLQKDVIVCPDRDNKGYDLVAAAIENEWAVSFPRWDIGIKDAAAATEVYGRLLTTYSIISSATIGKLNIQNRWQIEQNERDRKAGKQVKRRDKYALRA